MSNETEVEYITQTLYQLQTDGQICQRTDKPDSYEVRPWHFLFTSFT